jgi:hypothetical protein
MTEELPETWELFTLTVAFRKQILLAFVMNSLSGSIPRGLPRL